MILKPSCMAGIVTKVFSVNRMMLTAYHSAQTRKEALSHICMNPILTIGVGVVYPQRIALPHAFLFEAEAPGTEGKGIA